MNLCLASLGGEPAVRQVYEKLLLRKNFSSARFAGNLATRQNLRIASARSAAAHLAITKASSKTKGKVKEHDNKARSSNRVS